MKPLIKIFILFMFMQINSLFAKNLDYTIPLTKEPSTISRENLAPITPPEADFSDSFQPKTDETQVLSPVTPKEATFNDEFEKAEPVTGILIEKLKPEVPSMADFEK
jgi:hypothetical protein